jgi:hypothetical protein
LGKVAFSVRTGPHRCGVEAGERRNNRDILLWDVRLLESRKRESQSKLRVSERKRLKEKGARHRKEKGARHRSFFAARPSCSFFREHFQPICHLSRSYSEIQRSHSDASASLGMRQSPRGDRLIEPTFGPSGKHERLNWFEKKRRMNTCNQRRMISAE